MNEPSRRLIRIFTWSGVISVMLVGGFLALTEPSLPDSPEIALEVNPTPLVTLGVQRGLSSELLLEKVAEERLREASRVALISGQPMRSELWSTLQLEIIERVKDPLEVDSVLEELRFLKDQAYLPGATDDDTPPEAELVQYAFAEWARRDPVAALEREEQFLDLPTVYWYPLKGILSAWSETDPMNALDGMLERLKVESFHTGAVPMVEPVFRRCVKVDPESLMDRTREAHPYLVESAVDAACQWMNHDGEAVGNWLRAHPEHPVAMSPKFKKAWSKTVNKMKLSD